MSAIPLFPKRIPSGSALIGPTGYTGASSTVTGPTGPASFITGPTGSDSFVTGPTGASSFVTGPTGADSFVTGPTGQKGNDGNPGGSGLILFYNYYETPTGSPYYMQRNNAPTGPYGPVSYDATSSEIIIQWRLNPYITTDFEMSGGTYQSIIYAKSSSSGTIQITNVSDTNQIIAQNSNTVNVTGNTIQSYVLNGIINNDTYYFDSTNNYIELSFNITGNVEIYYQVAESYSLITFATPVIIVGPTGSIGPTGAKSTVTGPTGASSFVTGPTGASSNVTGPTGASSNVTGPTGAPSFVTGPTGASSNVTGPTGASSNVTGPTGASSFVTGPTGASSNVTGPTGASSNVTGPTGASSFVTGPTGASSNVTGPTGASSNVTGPTGAPSFVTGPTGASSFVTGPTGASSNVTGPTGASSNVTGPTGASSNVTGPTGAPSFVTGPTGEKSTITGPTGLKGDRGNPGGSGLILFYNYYETPTSYTGKPPYPIQRNSLPVGLTGPVNHNNTSVNWRLDPYATDDFEISGGTYQSIIYAETASAGTTGSIQITNINDTITGMAYNSNTILVSGNTVQPYVLNGIINDNTYYFNNTNNYIDLTLNVTGSVNIYYQTESAYSYINFATPVIVAGPTGPMGHTGAPSFVTGPTGASSFVTGPTGASSFVTGPTGASSFVTGPTGASSFVTGPTGASSFVTGPTGASSFVTGPTGAPSFVTGPTGAPSFVTGPTGAPSFVTGPTGHTGAPSFVTGPTGAPSFVTGPTGAPSFVTGPTGAPSFVTGPTGLKGDRGNPGGSGLILFYNYYETPTSYTGKPPYPIQRNSSLVIGTTGPVNYNNTTVDWRLDPYISDDFEISGGTYQSIIYAESASAGTTGSIQIKNISDTVTGFAYDSNIVTVSGNTVQPYVLNGIINDNTYYFNNTNNYIQLSLGVTGSVNIYYQLANSYSYINFATPVIVAGPTGPIGHTGAPSFVTGPTGSPSFVTGPTGSPSFVTGPTGASSFVTGPTGHTGAPSFVTGPTGASSFVTGPTGAPSFVTGPTGASSFVTGPTGAPSFVTGPTGHTGAPSFVTGPTGHTGAPSFVTGPTGAPSFVTGPTGAPSFVTGPTGHTGAPSFVTGPTGAPSFVTGPTGASSFVTGPTGAPSFVTGPTGLKGDRGNPGGSGLILFYNYYNTPTSYTGKPPYPIQRNSSPVVGTTGPVNYNNTTVSWRLDPYATDDFEISGGTYQSVIYAEPASAGTTGSIQINNIKDTVTGFAYDSNIVTVSGNTVQPYVLNGIINDNKYYFNNTNNYIELSLGITGSVNIYYQLANSYSYINFATPVIVAGPTGPIGHTGASSFVTGPTGPIGHTGASSFVTGPTGASSFVTGPTGASSFVTGPTGPIGHTGASSFVTGPTGASSFVTGPTGAPSFVTGPTGASSFVTGPTGASSFVTGPTGASSFVTGPTGASSFVTGPTGASSFVTGPTGYKSTVPGPTGPTGASSFVTGPTGPAFVTQFVPIFVNYTNVQTGTINPYSNGPLITFNGNWLMNDIAYFRITSQMSYNADSSGGYTDTSNTMGVIFFRPFYFSSNWAPASGGTLQKYTSNGGSGRSYQSPYYYCPCYNTGTTSYFYLNNGTVNSVRISCLSPGSAWEFFVSVEYLGASATGGGTVTIGPGSSQGSGSTETNNYLPYSS